MSEVAFVLGFSSKVVVWNDDEEDEEARIEKRRQDRQKLMEKLAGADSRPGSAGPPTPAPAPEAEGIMEENG